RWMLMPLNETAKINQRLEAVEWLILNTDERKALLHSIRQCGDVERLVSKVPLKKINPREVLHIARGLQQVTLIKQWCEQAGNPHLQRLGDSLNPCHFIAEKITHTIIENPPATAAKGGMITKGI